MFSRKQTAFFRRLYLGWNRTLGKLFNGLGRVCQKLFFYLWSWARARRWSYLVQGLPALAAGVGVLVLLLLRFSVSAQELEARYLDRAQNAFKAKDYPVAMVCYERLAALGQDRPENLYEMAFALGAQGEVERAFKIMNQLAPVEQKGYGLAHQWQAGYHLRGFGSAQQRKLAEEHLKHALQTNVSDVETIHAMLGELYALTGKHEQAVVHLARAVETRPHLRLRYAAALDALGKKTQAADQAKLAANFYRTRAEADIKDKAARGSWADALAFQQDFPQALAVLRDGFHLTGDDAYRPAMARVCLVWHLSVVKNKPDDVALQWELLQKGLELDSTNPQLLDRLLNVLGRGGKEADKARTLIQGKLAAGEATATSHFLLGMDAWERGDKAAALVHWERANQLSPNAPVIANNLAALLALRQPPDLPRALKVIDLVVEQVPANPTFRETRGQIYLKMGKWREALTDLEMVLAREPNFPGLHASLAEVYAQLNIPTMASEHRRLAEARDKKSKAAAN